jgi:hypothetical protein
MTLPLHKRYEIIFLHEHPKVENLSFSKIAVYIGCSKSTVIYWVQRWQISKDLTEEPKPGRQRSTTAKQDERIVKMAKTEHNITSTKIQGIMEKRVLTSVQELLGVVFMNLEANILTKFRNLFFRRTTGKNDLNGQSYIKILTGIKSFSRTRVSFKYSHQKRRCGSSARGKKYVVLSSI